MPTVKLKENERANPPTKEERRPQEKLDGENRKENSTFSINANKQKMKNSFYILPSAWGAKATFYPIRFSLNSLIGLVGVDLYVS